MTDTATQAAKMDFLLETLAPTIIKTIFDHFPRFPREVNGVKKYDGFMYVREVSETSFPRCLYGARLRDDNATFSTLMRKRAGMLSAGAVTSLEVREVGEGVEPGKEVYGGWAGDDGLSGLPELADHVWLAVCQFHAGKLTRDEYDNRISTRWQPIRDTCREYGVTLEEFLNFVDFAFEQARKVTISEPWRAQFPQVS